MTSVVGLSKSSSSDDVVIGRGDFHRSFFFILVILNHPIVKTTNMIQIMPITQLSHTTFDSQHIPVLPHPSEFTNPGEGLFVVVKAEQIIGFGSIQQYPHAPLTAGIGLMNHCYILPSERRKGYGNQLFRQLRQFAALHFDLLQLNEACPLHAREGGLIELF